MLKNITKKDLSYFLVIMAVIMVFSLAFEYSDSPDLISYFGFAGTLIGIILAVVALIYSFSQSSIFSDTSSKLDESAKKIEVVTEELRKVDNIEDFIMKIEEKYNQIDLKLHTTIHEISIGVEQIIKVAEHSDSNNKLLNSFFNDLSTSPKSKNSTTTNDSEISNIPLIDILNVRTHIFILYSIKCISEYNLRFSLETLIRFLLENKVGVHNDEWVSADEYEKKVILDRNIGVYLTIINIFENDIVLDGSLSNGKVQYFSNELKVIIENLMKENHTQKHDFLREEIKILFEDSES